MKEFSSLLIHEESTSVSKCPLICKQDGEDEESS